MGSISTEPGGRRTIQFVGSDGKRRSIRLGKVSQRTAEAVKYRVEQLNVAKMTGQAVNGDTARWVADRDVILADKLAAVGLIPRRERATLQAFLDSYIEGRTDVKFQTKWKYETTRQNLLDFFGSGKNLRDITPGDADDWRLRLAGRGLAENTVRKHTAIAKQFFHAAKRKRLVEENPFAGLKAAVQANPSRFYFITCEEAQQVLDACPDAQWRLIFALSRYSGLRCPSEHLALRWGDVDWERNRMTIRSPKTEHHPGGESRTVPLFPELRPYLEEVWEQAEPGTEYVITRYRDTNVNLRTQLLRIMQRAGVKPWPKLFQNLRSSRETELAQQFPIHVVCAWIGNSQSVAAKHYLQVTDEHFEQAAKEAVQNPVQQAHAQAGKASQSRGATPGFAESCNPLQFLATPPVAAVGVEPTTRGL